MSALWAPLTNNPEPAAPETEVSETQARPALRAVPQTLPRLARVPFLLVLIAIFGLGMTGLLMLNTTLQNQAFQSSTLNRQATELAYTQADLEGRLDLMAAPQELARRASAYGLRPNPYPAFIVLPDGKVVGTPRPVTGNEVPTMVIKTPAELAAERAAAAAEARVKAAQKVADAKAKVIQDRLDAAQKVAEAKTAAAQKVAQAKAAEAARKAAVAKAAAQKAAAQKAAQAAAKKAPPHTNNGGRG